jgi:hypothetical protein
VYVTDNTGWAFENISKSGDLTLPDGEFTITTDDLERRRFYINLTHGEFNNQKVAKVSFVTQGWAEQQNPSIVGITFPNEAPRPVELKPATSPTPLSQPPPGASGLTAPKPPTSPQPLVSDAAKIASNPMKASIEELESFSEKEFKEALEYAKKLREGKKD